MKKQVATATDPSPFIYVHITLETGLFALSEPLWCLNCGQCGYSWIVLPSLFSTRLFPIFLEKPKM